MMKRTVLCAVSLGLAAVMLAGCMPKMTIEEMKAEMPQRPPQLDKLNDFVGNWEGEGEATFAGTDQKLKTKGTSEMYWGVDGWYLIEESKFEMEEFGEFEGMALWTYDPKIDKYRTFWFDSMGSWGVGTAEYNEDTKVWKMKAKSHSSMGTSKGRGTFQEVSPNEHEYEFEEYATFLGIRLFKIMEMEGEYRKK